MRQAEEGVPIDEIALSQKRTVKAIKERIAMLAVNTMMRRGLSLQEASRMYNIDIVLLSRTYQSERDKMRKKTKMMRDACNKM
jgi:hypothetical protein